MKKIALVFGALLINITSLLAQNNPVTHTVNAGSFYYNPSSLTVNVGDSVVWINDGGYHNVNGDINALTGQSYNNPQSFTSNPINTVGAIIYAHHFTVPGSYTYDCSVGSHAANGMIGTITVQGSSVSALNLTGIMDFTVPTGGSDGKAIQLTANQNITDLSIYSINTFSNGSTNGGTAFTFPTISVNAGEHILLCRDSTDLSTYFGSCWGIFHHVIQGNQPTGNGDDATVLYMNNNAIETHGVVGVDGTGESWEYLDSWAWKDTASSNVGNWVYGAVNCSDGSSSMQTSSCPYPLCGVAPPISYNVTFSVNTANITVGPNGMYAGGGVLGAADALALSDPDGDGTWTGITSINAGTTGNYIFLNSPANGGDWGAKEDLAGQPCADPNNYNDRILPNIISDTTLLHCFGSCEIDGSCPAPSTNYTITFSVNTANITVGPNGMYAGGGLLGGSNALLMSDPDGDGVWTADTILPGTGAGSRNFAFFNSPSTAADWGTKESLSGLPCADAANYDDRNLPMFYSDTTLLYCFGSCETDGSCPPPISPVNITFQVDMSESSIANAIPYLRGSWNWGAPGEIMTDTNGDDVWEFTKIITGVSFEYIFAVDTNSSGSWDVMEQNDPNAPCTNGNAQYTNRVLTVPPSDTILDVVCYESCGPCGVTPPANELILKGIMSFDLPSSSGKAIHIEVTQNISDLSLYGLGTANNGGGSDGQEFTFPNVSANAGDHILVCRDSSGIASYLEADCYSSYQMVIQANEPTGNGNDAYELFENGSVIEVFGDVDQDGTGEPWEYTNSWAFKVAGNWNHGALNCTDSSATTLSSNCPYPFCSLTPPTNILGKKVRNEINVYPNPNNGSFIINSISEIQNISISDIHGKIVYYLNNISSNHVNIQEQFLNKGMYFINIYSNDRMISKTMIVE